MNLLYKENKHSGIAPVACWIHTLEHVYNHIGACKHEIKKHSKNVPRSDDDLCDTSCTS